MDPSADTRAPGCCDHGGAVWALEARAALPVAPHHNHAERVDGEVRPRTLFVAEPHLEPELRRRIESALVNGHLRGPRGVTTRWQLLSSGPSAVFVREKAHAHGLGQS